ncbi:MAG: CPBP family intramembrane metalloprotease [Bacillota bacterium]|nr:CPBP family intramembrane metalloprotease [Bacillota bacterium]
MTETRRTTRFAFLFFLYFLISPTIFVFIPSLQQPAYSGILMLLMQLVCFLPPIFIYFLYTKKNVRETLRLRPLGWKNLLLVISFGVSVQPIMSLLSYLTSLFFPNPVEQSIESLQASGFFISMLAVSIMPALTEEILSRGILLSGYRFLGKWKAAFLSALLFALLHINLQQLPYAFAVGFLFCFLVERTDSLYAGIVPHMIINGTTIVSIFTEGAGMGPVEMAPEAIFLSLGIMALFSLPWLAVLLLLFLKINPPREELPLVDETGAPYRERMLSPALIGIFLIFFLLAVLPYFLS